MKLGKLSQIIQDRKSNLCVGLDIRQGDKLEIAKTIIDATSEFAAAYKPNRQFWLGHDLDTMQSLNRYIHSKGCFSIVDHKLSDIGSSSVEALKHAKSEGFDLITISPFPGNLASMLEEAKKIDIGLIGLIMMSNPQAKWMIESPYLEWAKLMGQNESNIVIGTTNHVTEEIIAAIADVFNSGLILAPGIGQQGGRVDLLVKYFGRRVLFNVSRGIEQAEDYELAAIKYSKLISEAFGTFNSV